jgi:hypothetical protein
MFLCEDFDEDITFPGPRNLVIYTKEDEKKEAEVDSDADREVDHEIDDKEEEEEVENSKDNDDDDNDDQENVTEEPEEEEKEEEEEDEEHEVDPNRIDLTGKWSKFYSTPSTSQTSKQDMQRVSTIRSSLKKTSRSGSKSTERVNVKFEDPTKGSKASKVSPSSSTSSSSSNSNDSRKTIQNRETTYTSGASIVKKSGTHINIDDKMSSNKRKRDDPIDITNQIDSKAMKCVASSSPSSRINDLRKTIEDVNTSSSSSSDTSLPLPLPLMPFVS